MVARVPRSFSQPSRLGIASGKPVRGVQMTGIADALAYLMGRGNVLLPATHPEGNAIAISATGTYHLQLFEKAQAKHRVWFVRPITASGVAYGTFTDPSGGTSTFMAVESPTPEYRVSNTGFFHVETITGTRANGPTAVTVTIANGGTSTGTIVVQALACFELPRQSLEGDTYDLGADPDTLRADLPIFDAAYLSIGGLSRGIGNAQLYDPRVLFAYLRASGNGIDYKSGSQASIFDEGPVVQPSHQFRSETLRGVTAYAYAYCDVGTAGTLKFLATSGDSVTISVTATAGTWVSGSFDVYAEDLSTADGRRAATEEIVTVLAQRTSGGGSMWIESVMLVESRT